MNRTRATSLALALPFVLSCAIPLTVRRVDPEGAASATEVNGVRYKVNRPVTTIALRVPAAAKLSDLDGVDRCRFEIIVEQRMTDTWIYEAEYSPNFLADTDATLTLREDGSLSGVSAGETDRILPFLAAVAGLAVSVATTSKPRAVEDPCPIVELKALVTTQKLILEREKQARDRAATLRSKLREQPGADLEQIGKDLAALSGELERLKGDKARNKHTLTQQQALICIDGLDLVAAGSPQTERCNDPIQSGEWMRLNLRTKS